MREILFRGKRIDNGEWVEGNLFISDNATFIVCGSWYVKIEFEVIQESVSQYTGIKDKNGIRIFDGDIVKDTICEFKKGVVKFRTGTFDSGIYKYNGWVVEDKDGDVDHNPLIQYEKDSFGCGYGFEIIGNIYDNPELLER